MGLPANQPRTTIAEYLRREHESLEKHEYRDGEILLMAGGSADHSLIAANTIGELRALLKGKPCRVYDSNLRVRIARRILYTYPDATIICGNRETDPSDPSGETVTNPRVLVEVLSPTTEAYDRGEKFNRYRQLDSLEEYVLISQDTPRVECFNRQTEGAWLMTSYSGLDAKARIRCLGIEIELREIYAGVELPPADDTAI